MQAADTPFKDYWASTVHPAIKDDIKRLLETTPTRMSEKQAEMAEKRKEEAEKTRRRRVTRRRRSRRRWKR